MRRETFMKAARLRVLLAAGACSLALFVTGCASTAQNSGGKAGKTTLVCRTEKPTGSHISQRVCHEQHQVTDRRKNDQDAVRDLQHRDTLNTRQAE